MVNNIMGVEDKDLYVQKETTKEVDNTLGKDAFMQLLMTQMQYQDPLNPMDTTDMLAQLAQFTALEQMLNVAQASQKQLAHEMIGTYVEYLYTDESTGQTSYETGKVDYVKITGDTPILGIGSHEVELDKVYQVLDSSNIQAAGSAFDVIGKTVQATYQEKNLATGKMETITIEGEVKRIKMVNGKPEVIIGSEDDEVIIPYDNVESVVENTSVTGREVTGTIVTNEGEQKEITGIVDYIKITEDGTYLRVNGELINFDDVEFIG